VLDVVVIGAGAAGIAAARRLAELHLAHRVIEAKSHLGGRAVTDNESFGAPVDLGCHWLHSPDRNPLKAWADAFAVRYLASPYTTRYARGGHWLDEREGRAHREHVEACFARIAAAGRGGRDCAVSELIAGATPADAAFAAEYTAKDGVAPHEGSTLDFARYVWVGDDLPVVGGLGNLVAKLAAGVGVALGAPATRVDWSDARAVRIETPQGRLEARAVILTVSTAVLAEGIRFAPALPEWKRTAIENLPMGSCNKIALAFERPVFGALRNALVLPQRGAEESVEIVVRPDGAELAVCLVSGPFGRALARAGAGAMAEYALERLCEIFGAALRSAVRPAHVLANWDVDPYVRGYVAAARPGWADARRELARGVEDRLFFAGEATHPRFMGDVHGAWLSGMEAAEAVAGALGKRC